MENAIQRDRTPTREMLRKQVLAAQRQNLRFWTWALSGVAGGIVGIEAGGEKN